MKPSLIETLTFRGPPGFYASVTAAAEKEGVSFSEFIRRAVAQKLGTEPPKRQRGGKQ